MMAVLLLGVHVRLNTTDLQMGDHIVIWLQEEVASQIRAHGHLTHARSRCRATKLKVGVRGTFKSSSTG